MALDFQALLYNIHSQEENYWVEDYLYHPYKIFTVLIFIFKLQSIFISGVRC